MREDIVYLWLFGLATEDDDGNALKPKPEEPKKAFVDYNAPIPEEKVKAFMQWVEANKISDDYLIGTLQSYGYELVSDIKNKDLKKITNQLQEMLKGE